VCHLERGSFSDGAHVRRPQVPLLSFAVRRRVRQSGYFSDFGEENDWTQRRGTSWGGAVLVLEGIERLDGSLILWVAELAFDRLGHVEECGIGTNSIPMNAWVIIVITTFSCTWISHPHSSTYRQDKILKLLDYHFDIEGVMKKAQ
jgi:hypothetical protein